VNSVAPPYKSLRRTFISVTFFALAKTAPLTNAAELQRYIQRRKLWLPVTR